MQPSRQQPSVCRPNKCRDSSVQVSIELPVSLIRPADQVVLLAARNLEAALRAVSAVDVASAAAAEEDRAVAILFALQSSKMRLSGNHVTSPR